MVAADEIHWYKNLDEARQVALKTNRPMFVDFWADWCIPCRVMDAEVYTDPKVIEAFRRRLVGVRIHFDLQPEVAREYNVPGLPYLLFTSSHGTPLVYNRGLLEAEDLTRIVEAMPSMAAINKLDQILRTQGETFAGLVSMGRLLRASAFFEASTEFHRRALRHRDAAGDAVRRELALYELALNALELQDGEAAAAALQRLLAEFPRTARKADVLLALSRAHRVNQQEGAARTVLRTIVADHPDTPAAAEARQLLAR
jgi:thioredoxin-like negative regulator of GroEL